MIQLSKFSSIIESTFTDKMSGYHYTTKTNDDNTTSTVLPETFSYENQPCRISFPKMENPQDSSDEDVPVSTTIKIFCNKSCDIRQGDLVTVTRFAEDNITVLAQYTGTLGLPNTFQTHKEVLVSIKESA